jgi:hypothetical protein
MSDDERVRRDYPGRGGPMRNSRVGLGGDGGSHPDPEATVDEVVAYAVRVGYQVIGENIQQGRIAADRYSAGCYTARDVPDDLSQLSIRLLQATRDLSTTAFDLFGAILRDPTLRNAVQRQNLPRRSTRRGPMPTGAMPGVGMPVGGGPGTHMPATPGTMPVPLTYNIRSSKQALGVPCVLRQPEQPAMLFVDGLSARDQSVHPLRDVSFSPSPDGYGVVATINVPHKQPAGTYSGIVYAGDTDHPIGTITVQVIG